MKFFQILIIISSTGQSSFRHFFEYIFFIFFFSSLNTANDILLCLFHLVHLSICFSPFFSLFSSEHPFLSLSSPFCLWVSRWEGEEHFIMWTFFVPGLRLFPKYKWFSFSGTFAKPGQITRRLFPRREKIYCAQLLQTILFDKLPQLSSDLTNKRHSWKDKLFCFGFALFDFAIRGSFFRCLEKLFLDRK